MRVISIAQDSPEIAGCEEDSGIVRKVNLPLARREFLKGSGLLMGTLASGSLLATLAPSTAWALELKKLSTAEGQTLMAMGRILFPHKKLPDAVYALLAKDLDALIHYRQASADGVRAHPSEDHFLPLFTALGAAGPQAQAEPFFRGVSDYVIAMDGYRFH